MMTSFVLPTQQCNATRHNSGDIISVGKPTTFALMFEGKERTFRRTNNNPRPVWATEACNSMAEFLLNRAKITEDLVHTWLS